MLASRSILVNILLLLFFDGVYGESSFILKNEVENISSENPLGLQKNNFHNEGAMRAAKEFWELWKDILQTQNVSRINRLMHEDFSLMACYKHFTKDEFVGWALKSDRKDPNALRLSTVDSAWYDEMDNWIRFVRNSKPPMEFLLDPQRLLSYGRLTDKFCDNQHNLGYIAEDFMLELTRAIRRKQFFTLYTLFKDNFRLKGCRGTVNKTQFVMSLMSFPTDTMIYYTIGGQLFKDFGDNFKFDVTMEYHEPKQRNTYYQFVLSKTSKQLKSGKCLDHNPFPLF